MNYQARCSHLKVSSRLDLDFIRKTSFVSYILFDYIIPLCYRFKHQPHSFLSLDLACSSHMNDASVEILYLEN